MKNAIFYAVGGTPATRYACQFLAKQFEICSSPGPDVTHLLLPVPSFEADGRIRGGGVLEHILADLPERITVVGGNLDHPALTGYKTVDLLRNEQYLADNAAITADCAIRVAGTHMPMVFAGCRVLVIGWGRIGKCLAAQLRVMGAAVTVTSRKAEDRCLLRAMGYGAEDPGALSDLSGYRMILNTAPATVLNSAPRETIKIDLASKPGILGADVIRAGGLPGKMAPESSGKLIARTIIRLFEESEADK